MKKFKQFKSEQQHITEVGPYASAFMAAAGLVGLGVAGFKLFKSTKEKIKGYRETKAEKKQNPAGEKILVPEFNPQTGKVENTKEVKTPSNWPSVSGGGLTNKELKAFKQKFKDKAEADKEAWDIKNPGKAEKLEKEAEKQKQAEKKKEKEIEKAAQDKEDQDKADQELEDEGENIPASQYVGEPVKTIPKSKHSDVKEIERGEIKGDNPTKAVVTYMKRWGLKSVQGFDKETDADGKLVGYIKSTDQKKDNTSSTVGTTTRKKPSGGLAALGKKPKIKIKRDKEGKAVQVKSQRILKFGEFISEGVMDDLKKASKSRKDSEITLDDGADIPIDPLTSQILVKYIEGLSSSEKNRTIQQIQRTERAFMKVLGKAHEG